MLSVELFGIVFSIAIATVGALLVFALTRPKGMTNTTMETHGISRADTIPRAGNRYGIATLPTYNQIGNDNQLESSAKIASTTAASKISLPPMRPMQAIENKGGGGGVLLPSGESPIPTIENIHPNGDSDSTTGSEITPTREQEKIDSQLKSSNDLKGKDNLAIAMSSYDESRGSGLPKNASMESIEPATASRESVPVVELKSNSPSEEVSLSTVSEEAPPHAGCLVSSTASSKLALPADSNAFSIMPATALSNSSQNISLPANDCNVNHQAIPIAYCVKCRSKKQIRDPRRVTMKNGRLATSGYCFDCGSKVYRLGS